MRRVVGSEAIIWEIADVTGLPAGRVAKLVGSLRDAMDALLLDGYTIFAPPFSLTFPSDPVGPTFADRFTGASDAAIEAWHLGDMEATARWLDVPLATYMRHPVASDLRVFMEMPDALDVPDADSPEGQ